MSGRNRRTRQVNPALVEWTSRSQTWSTSRSIYTNPHDCNTFKTWVIHPKLSNRWCATTNQPTKPPKNWSYKRWRKLHNRSTRTWRHPVVCWTPITFHTYVEYLNQRKRNWIFTKLVARSNVSDPRECQTNSLHRKKSRKWINDPSITLP